MMAGMWRTIIRRKRIGVVTCNKEFEVGKKEDQVVLRVRDTRKHDGTNKRATINLGVEDLPAGPRPESAARFNTDDVLGLNSNDVSWSRNQAEDEEKEGFGAFLIREYLRNEDAERLRMLQKEVTWADKDSKLRERRKSLIVPDYNGVSQLRKKSSDSGPPTKSAGVKRDALYLDILGVNVENRENIAPAEDIVSPGSDKVFSDDIPNECKGRTSSTLSENNGNEVELNNSSQGSLPSQGGGKPPVAPPRKKRDARRKAAERERKDSDSTSSTPRSPISPLSPSVLFSSFTIAEDSSTSGTPDTPSSPQSPTERDSRDSTDSDVTFLLIPDSPSMQMSSPLKSRTLENRSKRKSKEHSTTWQLSKQKSSEDLSSAKHRRLRRSVSEYVDGPDSSAWFNKSRRSNSEKVKSKKGEKDGRSLRDFFMGKRKDTATPDDVHKAKSSRSLPNRTFERIMSVRNKTPAKPPKVSSGYTSDGDEGSVGGAHLKHDRNSAPSSPQLAASRSADSTPSKFAVIPPLTPLEFPLALAVYFVCWPCGC